jgi:hypothetical protein
MARTIISALIAVTLFAACDRAAEPELTTTTTTEAAPVVDATETTMAPVTETTAEAEESVSTVASNPIEDYTIELASTSDEGEMLWVSVPPENYTDRDLENFVIELRDEREGLATLFVLDDSAAVEALRIAEEARTEEEQALVDTHFLVSLTDGNVIEFHGPFATLGSYILGS